MNIFTEYPEKDEKKYFDLVVEQTRFNMDKLYKEAEKAFRDTHIKTHACVQGTLEIFDFDETEIKQKLSQNTSLSEAILNQINLKQGLLTTPKQYPVWLRFANGRTQRKGDYEPDTRSMSVKVMGVEGERLPESHESNTQDIVVQNAEIFFIKTIKNYYGFFSAVVKAGIFPILWLLFHPKQKNALQTITSRIPQSLLTERYWSGSASALGLKPDFDAAKTGVVSVEYPAVIKYAFTPVSPQPPHTRISIPSRSESSLEQGKTKGIEDHYYREELIQSLAKSEAEYCWDFQIQVQTKPEMSIDDVTIVWNEDESPFLTVGRLTIKHQQINFEKQCDFCENLRFSPWNGLAVHRPVGALNRLRSIVYSIVGEYRHQKQGLNYQEPTGTEEFN
ncbi:MAG: catalase [Cyanobacteria bacterium J06592_8]